MSSDLPDETHDETPTGEVTVEEPSNVTPLFKGEGPHLRMLEALLFAAGEPLDEESLATRLPSGVDVGVLLEQLQAVYDKRGVNLIQVGGRWTFRTAPDLAFLMQREAVEQRRLSRAGIETLAIIAYHQPVTRAEIEEIRGVSVSKGTLDVLMEVGWIRPRGRRRTPGRPVTYGTSAAFMDHFGLAAIGDLPGLEELKAAGLLDANLPPDFSIPTPDENEDTDEDLDDEGMDELELGDPESIAQFAADLEAEAEGQTDRGEEPEE
jgi:segregation and condensation protein B